MPMTQPKCTRCGADTSVPGLCYRCIAELDRMHKELIRLDPREPYKGAE